MHNKIDCIDTGDGSHHHITRVTEEVGEVVGIFGAPTVLNRMIVNKYISDFVHNRTKKVSWTIKLY
jgi:hypothetical protein